MPADDCRRFGDLLRRCRLAAELTQEALAERAGLSVRGIQDLERGVRSAPRMDTVRLLADALRLRDDARAAFRAAARKPSSSEATGELPARRFTALPAQPTSLIGREKIAAHVRQELLRPDVRLVTLTGPAGTGKTRLAVAVASDLHDRFEHGAVFVDLAPLGDANLVIAKVAQALGVTDGHDLPLAERVQWYLKGKQLLLLIDNFEHVLDAAPSIATVLEICAEIKVLATSRAALHLRWEHECAVPPLDLPNLALPLDPATIMATPSVALFAERARAVDANFRLGEADARSVGEICVRLDGLPLAIELAAARVRLLSPGALLERLGGGQADGSLSPAAASAPLQVLTGGPLDLPARQRTLREAIAWSYALLPASEQALFRRLAIFAGGWTLGAAEAATMDGGRDEGAEGAKESLLDRLGSLVAQSLVRQEWGVTGEPRFSLLETIREYAWEQLVAHGELEAVQAQHAAYYLTLAEKAEPLSLSQPAWLGTLETEIHNLRAALRGYAQRGEVEAALRLATALHPLWVLGGHVAEGQRSLHDLLELEAGGAYPAARAGALFAAAVVAYFRQDYPAARRLYEESVLLRRQLRDRPGLAASLSYLSMVAREQGDYSAARRLGAETLAIYEEVADERGTAMALCRLAEIDHIEGDYAAASRGYERSLAFYRKLGRSPFLAWSLHHLGRLALDQGDHAAAGAWMREALAVRRTEGDALGMLYSLATLASLAAAEGQPARALRLAGAAAALSTTTGTALQPTERRSSERWLALARAALHSDAAAAAWAEGETMPLEQAITYALQEMAPP